MADHEPVTITFSLAFRQLEWASATAADLVRACAFLAPDAIPEELFISGAAELGEKWAAMAGGGLNLVKVIGEAGRFSLIRRDAKGGMIEIHRLVQQVIKDEMDAGARRLWAERVVRGVNAAFPAVANHEEWPLCEKLLPHVLEVARLIQEYGLEFDEAARLLNEAGYYCNERAQYTEAEPLLVRSLSIREKVFGLDHPQVAASLVNLGHFYDEQGRYTEAEPLLVRALNIREKALRPDNPDIAQSLSGLADLYNNQGRYVEAEPLYLRALSLLEQVLGPDHSDTSKIRGNYVELLKKMHAQE
jgi:tetratricopeptide (TPR) repeat protein